jgi:hypothetical protein
MNRQQIIAVILIGIGLFAGSFLVHHNQKLRSRSEDLGELGSVSFERGGSFGDIKTLNLIISTGDLESGNEALISSISIKAKLGDTNADLSFVNDLQESSSEMVPSRSFAKSGEWLFPVNTIYKEEGQYYLELVAVNTSPGGFSSIAPVKLGSIFVKSSSVGIPKAIIVKEYTKMMSKQKPVIDILP